AVADPPDAPTTEVVGARAGGAVGDAWSRATDCSIAASRASTDASTPGRSRTSRESDSVVTSANTDAPAARREIAKEKTLERMGTSRGVDCRGAAPLDPARSLRLIRRDRAGTRPVPTELVRAAPAVARATSRD